MNEESRADAVIRTPDRRLRVFVSSTMGEQGELAQERQAAARAISALRLTPVLFELGARPYAPRELYRAYLAQSDVFVGLYWQRYGQLGPGMERSGLEEEFELSAGLPRLLYVKTPSPDREPRLAGLLARIRQEASDSYRYFRTPAELGRLVRDEEAWALLDEGLDLSLATHSTRNVTLCLAAFAQLAFAEGEAEWAALLAGAAEGLRRRVGLRAWPLQRQGEAQLLAQIRQALGADRFDEVFAAGARLNRPQAVAAVHDRRGAGTRAS